MTNPWKTLKKAMGRNPSPSPRSRALSRLTYEELAEGLSTLEIAPAPLTEERISRIELKIFQALGEPRPPAPRPGSRPVAEGPVPAEYLRGFALGTIDDTPQNRALDFADLGELVPLDDIALMLGGISEEDLQIEEELEDLGEAGLPEDATRKGHPRRVVRKALATAAALYLLAGTAVAASHRAAPGEMLYPLRLQVEAVRLSLASGDLGKASHHISIASSRLAMLRGDADLSDIPLIAGEMDSSGLDALTLLKNAEASTRRNALASRLLGLAYAEQQSLRRLMNNSPVTVFPAVSRSFSTATYIAGETTKLLLTSGSLPLPPVMNAPLLPAEAATQDSAEPIASFVPKAPTAPGRGGEKLDPGSGTQLPPTPQDTDDEEDGDSPCSVTSGDVCIILPPLPEIP